MNEIFLSYRRDDTQTETLLLFEHLARRFGAEHVFQDEGIPPGDDFRVVLEQRLHDCRVVLAVIGPRWLDETNKQRLHQENDWVRRELETALNASKPVIPVLVNGAKRPRAEDLPEGKLRDQFPAQQGPSIRTDNNFASDLARVRERIAECTGLTPREGDDAAWTYAPLPPRPTCLGRDAKREQLVEQLLTEPAAPIVVQGGPGFGKTTLTVDALYDPRVQARFAFRCFFVRCEAATSVAALVDLLASAFNLIQTQDPKAALLRRLQELAPLVLVLDNAETPWHGERRACEEIFARLAAVPLCRLVLTVRGKERPVGLAWQPPVEVERLVRPFDREMFLRLAGPAFAADPALDRLLAALAGWPLPIGLLAQQAQDYSDLAELERRWRKEKEKLLVVAGREDDFHWNFPASVELSIQSKRVDEAARRLLSLLGMLPDGMLRDHLDSLLPDAGDAAASTLRKVGLAFDEGPRLRVHPFLRDYLERKYAPNPEDRDRALCFYLQAAGDGEKAGGSDGAAAIERVTQELTNILFAVNASLADSDPSTGIEAAFALGEFVRFTGAQEPLSVLAAAEQQARTSEEKRSVARLVERLGDIALDRSQHNQARVRYEQALPLYRQVGDVLGEANCIKRLGDIALRRSQHDEARGRYEQALPLYRQVGAVLGEANCIQSLGDIALRRSQHDEARQRFLEALELYRRIPEPYSIGWAHVRLARLAEGDERQRHVAAARAAWQSIDRPDLVRRLEKEFGT